MKENSKFCISLDKKNAKFHQLLTVKKTKKIINEHQNNLEFHSSKKIENFVNVYQEKIGLTDRLINL